MIGQLLKCYETFLRIWTKIHLYTTQVQLCKDTNLSLTRSNIEIITFQGLNISNTKKSKQSDFAEIVHQSYRRYPTVNADWLSW